MARAWSEKIGTLIDGFMHNSLERFANAVCPIFLSESKGCTVCLGTGVLLQLQSKPFLLTAAHVTDQRCLGRLSIPGRAGDVGLSGYYSGMRLPPSGDRTDDRYDIAYVRLEEKTVQMLHPALSFLTWEDVDVFDTSVEGDAYSFIGYPYRKSHVAVKTISTELGSFSGEGAKLADYSRLRYKPQHHILIRFRRHKALNYGTGQRQTAVHPEGLSGGAVVAWDKYMEEKTTLPPPPKLVGILTTYHQAQHHLAATRINCFLECIWKNNPDLPFAMAPPFDHSERSK